MLDIRTFVVLSGTSAGMNISTGGGISGGGDWTAGELLALPDDARSSSTICFVCRATFCVVRTVPLASTVCLFTVIAFPFAFFDGIECAGIPTVKEAYGCYEGREGIDVVKLDILLACICDRHSLQE